MKRFISFILTVVLCGVTCFAVACSPQEETGTDTATGLTREEVIEIINELLPTDEAEQEQEANQEQGNEAEIDEYESEEGQEAKQETKSEVIYPAKHWCYCSFCGYDNAHNLYKMTADSGDLLKCLVCGWVYEEIYPTIKKSYREEPEIEAEHPYKTTCTCWKCNGELWAINNTLYRCIDCWSTYKAEDGQVKYMYS